MITTLDTLSELVFPLKKWDRIFLYGNLWSGKTTFSQELIRKYLWDYSLMITSPTFTYYQLYGTNLYHFDLYRVEHIDDIVRIGAEEIFEDEDSICIIEWPEILVKKVKPTTIIELCSKKDWKEILITHCQADNFDNK